MARPSGFSTPSLLGDLLRSGCPALGPFPGWGGCGAEVTKATQDFKQVLASAKWVRHAVVGKVGPGADEEAAHIVWDKTEAEVQLCKALSPFDAWEIDEQTGAVWVPTP